MDQKTQEKINKNIVWVNPSNRTSSHINCIRLNTSCSDKHNDEIIKRCKEYLKLGVPFMTEVIFITGGRADIFLPSIPLIEEIMVTETKERLEEKDYPFPIKAIKVKDEQRTSI